MGEHTLVESLELRSDRAGPASGSMHETAARGVASGGGSLPYFDQVQAAFGRFDVSSVKAHHGPAAAAANQALGAEAYATGD